MKYLQNLSVRSNFYQVYKNLNKINRLSTCSLILNQSPVTSFENKKLIKNERYISTTRINRTSKDTDPYQKPTKEQLLLLKEKLTYHLPRFLTETHPYNLYTQDIVFENFYNEPGKITIGPMQYAIQLTFLRMKIHWKFSHARLEVLKITVDDSDGTVKVRWRIVGVRGMKSMIKPWKIKAWNVKETIQNESEWHDGFSILYVRGDGLIYKHTLQRVMSSKDEETVLVDKTKKVENLDVTNTICTKQN